MADTIKSSSELKLVQKFYDGDTRTESVPNPVSGLSAADIKEVEAFMISTQVTVGDKTGARFVGYESPARIVEQTRTYLDLK